MENLTEHLTNELNELEIMSSTKEEKVAAFGEFLFDLIARVNLGGDNSITNVYYPEQLEEVMEELKADPFLPEWVYEKFNT